MYCCDCLRVSEVPSDHYFLSIECSKVRLALCPFDYIHSLPSTSCGWCRWRFTISNSYHGIHTLEYAYYDSYAYYSMHSTTREQYELVDYEYKIMCDLSYVTPKLKLQSSLSACQLINKKICMDTSYHLVVLVSYFTRGGSKYTTSYSSSITSQQWFWQHASVCSC